MRSLRGFRGRRQDRRIELLVSSEVRRKVDVVGCSRPARFVVSPQRTGDVAADDELDGISPAAPADDHAGVGRVDDVMRDDVLRVIEARQGEGIQDLSLEWNRSEDMVEGADPIRRDQDQAVSALVDVADLSSVERAETREIGGLQRVVELALDQVACGQKVASDENGRTGDPCSD